VTRGPNTAGAFIAIVAPPASLAGNWISPVTIGAIVVLIFTLGAYRHRRRRRDRAGRVRET